MDYTYLGKSFFSMLFFAPGVFMLALCVIISLLLMVEKALTQDEAPAAEVTTEGTLVAATANPSPGRIVSDLSSSLKSEEQGQQKDRAAG